METIPPDILQMVQMQAPKKGLEPNLVLAIIKRESDFQQYAMRYEPAFKYFWDPEGFSRKVRVSIETERIGQATSWGLMQIMGAVAREYYFTRPFGLLFEPETNIEYGCRHLKTFFTRYGNIQDAVASYNAGSPRLASDGKLVNQPYVDFVLTYKSVLDKA